MSTINPLQDYMVLMEAQQAARKLTGGTLAATQTATQASSGCMKTMSQDADKLQSADKWYALCSSLLTAFTALGMGAGFGSISMQGFESIIKGSVAIPTAVSGVVKDYYKGDVDVNKAAGQSLESMAQNLAREAQSVQKDNMELASAAAEVLDANSYVEG